MIESIKSHFSLRSNPETARFHGSHVVVFVPTFREAAATSLGSFFVSTSQRVCGGEQCVRGTRIPLWVLYRAKKRGDTNASLRRKYPILKTMPLLDIVAYMETQKTHLERAISSNEQW